MSASTAAGASSVLKTIRLKMTTIAMMANPVASPTGSVAKITLSIPSPNASSSDKSKVGL